MVIIQLKSGKPTKYKGKESSRQQDRRNWGVEQFLKNNSFVYPTYNFPIRSSIFPQWLTPPLYQMTWNIKGLFNNGILFTVFKNS